MLVNKLPLQVISGLLFILVESRFPFTVRTFVFFSLSGSLLANAQLKTSDTDDPLEKEKLINLATTGAITGATIHNS